MILRGGKPDLLLASNVTLENNAELTLCLRAIVNRQTIRLVTANELK